MSIGQMTLDEMTRIAAVGSFPDRDEAIDDPVDVAASCLKSVTGQRIRFRITFARAYPTEYRRRRAYTPHGPEAP